LPTKRGDPQKAYIADGLTSSITADLSRIRDAFIVPVSSAIAYRDKAAPVKQIGLDLGVRFVLQGSVLANGNKLRINAQLADTQSGAQKWTETFEGDLADLFALQDQVTARIGNSIGNRMVILAARESQTRKSGAKVADLILRADAFQGDTSAALRNEERRVALDPRNPGAYNDLAVLYYHLGQPAKAIEHLNRALALYPKGFDTLFVNLGVSYFMLEDYSAAAAWAQKSIDTNTGLDDGYTLLAVAYAEQGDVPRASAAATEARRRFPDLKPRTLSARECVSEGWCQFLQSKYLPAWRRAGLP
jgi:TolB-like protein